MLYLLGISWLIGIWCASTMVYAETPPLTYYDAETLSVSDSHWTVQYQFYKDNPRQIMLGSLSYRHEMDNALYIPQFTSEDDHAVIFQLEIPRHLTNNPLEEPFLIRYQTQDGWIEQSLPDTLKTQSLTYQGHHFFGESLHLKIQEEDIQSYQLYQHTQPILDIANNNASNKGLQLSDLEVGTYTLLVNEQCVTIEEEDFRSEWYLLPRQNERKKVTLSSQYGYLTLTVEQIEALPAHVYDLLIDAGHGGPDSGATAFGLTEANEVLKLSLYLAQQFESAGLKVKLSRTDNREPSTMGFDYQSSPYLDNGRVDQVYDSMANYVISNHLNAFNGTATGYEIYSGITTTNEWASAIAKGWQSIGRRAHDSRGSSNQVAGTYKRSFVCESGDGCWGTRDYLYMIRETGGDLTKAYKLKHLNADYRSSLTYGAESILIEYAYLDNRSDKELWLKNWKTWADIVVAETLTYFNLS